MKCYFAPMEGITGYLYRNAHHQYFDHIDEYFTPFITPNQTRKLTARELNDLLPEHNQNIPLVPQILTNRAEDFLWASGTLKGMGYQKVNLNLGCPSGTVVSKHRGSGFLERTMELDRFLYETANGLEKLGMKYSVKTRIGRSDPDEFEDLLTIFNRYPLEELIIHPRIQTDYYKNHPNMEVFAQAVNRSIHPVCYNGDLFSAEAIRSFREQFGQVDMLMLGRGLLTNPALAAAVQGEAPVKRGVAGSDSDCPFRHDSTAPDKSRLKDFHDTILDGYRTVIPGDRNVLFKMKELWVYLGCAFRDGEKCLKKIKKAQRITEYEAAVAILFAETELLPEPVFSWKKQEKRS